MKKGVLLFLCAISVISGVVLALEDVSRTLVFCFEDDTDALPLDSIAQVVFFSSNEISNADVRLTRRDEVRSIPFDSIIHAVLSDTLYLTYFETGVSVRNPRADQISVILNGNDVEIQSSRDVPNLVISANGSCVNGRLRVVADTTYTLYLCGLSLSSDHAPAFNSSKNKRVRIVLADNSENFLTDAIRYDMGETDEIANGCLSVYGPLSFEGEGQLTVRGNYKHAIYSKKSITFTSGNITVEAASSDAIHTGKNLLLEGGNLVLRGMQNEGIDVDNNFTMNGGSIDLNITGEAAKGIQCGDCMVVSGGNIQAVATGDLKNKNGDLGYCTILKCDSDMVLSGGVMHLSSSSPGGKCISVNKNMTITGGEISLETVGDGAQYTNDSDELDYYTSKCLAVDDSLFIHGGTITCFSTGLGGKGIVADEYLEIGSLSEDVHPVIRCETTNSCIINNVDEDLRFGCPKAIKVNQKLFIFGGDIYTQTSGMGGEGIECNKEFYFQGGNLVCECYDDGINVGENLVIDGGTLYCSSIDNDGIDSNGSITINGGVVAAINHKKPNESFDTEKRNFRIYDGIVFGIGSSMVKVGDAVSPYYNTVSNNDPDMPIQRGLSLEFGKYVYVMSGSEVIMALLNENEERRAFVTAIHPVFEISQEYSICQGDKPIDSEMELFNGKMTFGGKAVNANLVESFYPKY